MGISMDDLFPIGVAQPGFEEAQRGRENSGTGIAALVSLVLADLCLWILSSEATCVRRTCRALSSNGGPRDSLAAFEAHRRNVRIALQTIWQQLCRELEVRLASKIREGTMLRILASAVDCLDSCSFT